MSYEKRIKPTDCPDAEHLERFGRGALPEELIAMFSDHLTQCDQCCRELSNQDDRHDPLITALFDSSIEFNEAEIEQMELLGGDGFGFGIDGEDTFKRSTTCVGRIIDESIPRIDNYTVQRLIGRGGMGSVYAAIHCSLDRPVAIKVLSPARTADESATTRFRGEMKAVGRVNHPPGKVWLA